MAKKQNKITKDELNSVQSKVNSINQVNMQIGGVETQKSLLIDKVKILQEELIVIQKTLEDKYGQVSVNINDATINDKPSNGSLN